MKITIELAKSLGLGILVNLGMLGMSIVIQSTELTLGFTLALGTALVSSVLYGQGLLSFLRKELGLVRMSAKAGVGIGKGCKCSGQGRGC